MLDPAEFDKNAPRVENLARAESMVNGIRASKRSALTGAGLRRVPTKICPVCGELWDFHDLSSVPEPAAGLCGDCLSALRNGMTAVVLPGSDKYAWIKQPAPEIAGKIIRCTSEADFATVCRLPPPPDETPQPSA